MQRTSSEPGEWFGDELRALSEFPSLGGVPERRGGPGRSRQNYDALPFNSKLKERARELRKAQNLAEVLLWLQLKNKQLCGLDFDRQKIIGNYIVDFYCASLGLVIEVDGSSHDNKYEYDQERNAYLRSLGLFIIHVIDVEITENMDSVLKALREAITEVGGDHPVPSSPMVHPSQGGEFARGCTTSVAHGRRALAPREGRSARCRRCWA